MFSANRKCFVSEKGNVNFKTKTFYKNIFRLCPKRMLDTTNKEHLIYKHAGIEIQSWVVYD